MNQNDINNQSSTKPTNQREVYEDEIDLVELFKVFWGYKYLFIAIVSASVLAGFIYLQFQKPIYQASYYFSKPTLTDISELNPPILNYSSSSSNNNNSNSNQDIIFNNYSDNYVFERFTGRLQSKNSFRSFLNLNEIKQKLISEYEIDQQIRDSNITLVQLFSNNLSSDCKNAELQKKLFDTPINNCLSFDFPDPNDAAEILNRYFQFINDQVVSELIENRNLQINQEINKLEALASNLKTAYFSNKESRIEFLEESLAIAKKVNISKSTINEADNRFNMEYMRGFESLQAELDALINRQNDDLFIEELAEVNQLIAQLKNLSIDSNKLSAFKIELEAFPNNSAIKPNKKLILLIFLIFGTFGSIVLITIRHLITREKN